MNYKLLLLIEMLVLSFSGYSQLGSTFGFKVGYDKQYNIYDNLYGENYDAFPDFNIGFDASIGLTDNIRIRGELKYGNVAYTRNYGTPSSLLENIEYSKMQIHNLNLNPYVDFRILNIRNKFELFYTLGAKLEFSLSDRQRAFTYEGEKIDASYVLDEHKGLMFGNATGLIFKYNINKHWGLTLSPEYSIFWGRYYDLGDGDYYDDHPEFNRNYYMRSSVNFGVEYTF